MMAYTGVIPLPAAMKTNRLNFSGCSGKIKNPDAPMVVNLSPGLNLSINRREYSPLGIRLMVIVRGSSTSGDEETE